MGFLLKETLKTLCGSNQWSYAIFWKIGCQNPRLLIWEECHCEPSPRCSSQCMAAVGTSSLVESWVSGSQSTEFGGYEVDRVTRLINEMMMNDHVNLVGEGMIGRAAFTGNHQWIILNNCTRNAHPPEVLSVAHHHISAGMQTLAVIPVLPHGVVQFGSSHEIMENFGFVNDVKSLILQLGCTPKAFLSENYASKVIGENLGVPVTCGVPLCAKSNGISTVANFSPSTDDVLNLQNEFSHISLPLDQSSDYLLKNINNNQNCEVTYQAPYLSHMCPNIADNLSQVKAIPIVKHNVVIQKGTKIVGAEVIPSNVEARCQQQSAACNSRSGFNTFTDYGHLNISDCDIKPRAQHVSFGEVIVNSNATASKASQISQMRTNGGPSHDHNQVAGLNQARARISNHSRQNPTVSSVSNPSTLTDINNSSALQTGSAPKIKSKSDAVVLSAIQGQSHTNSLYPEGFSVENRRAQNGLALTKTNANSLWALDMPSFHSEECVSAVEHPGFLQESHCNDRMSGDRGKMLGKQELFAQPLSGDDLFDVFGVDFKNKLMNGNWDDLVDREPHFEANTSGKSNPTFGDMQEIGLDCFSVNETTSDGAVFSEMGSDNLLDAVVSMAQTGVKQISDDNVSCKTTLTGISSSSLPSSSLTNRQVNMHDDFLRALLGNCAQTSSLNSVCSKDEIESCSQTNSRYGSHLSSTVEQGSNLKHENSVTTAHSKRPDEVSRSTRKRLKPGENPRPRPKDRQMIQDRVKELREIVPNGAKCTIDALFERTIKHMLFLQSVTKHADKLKQTGDSKIIGKEGRFLLRDNFEGGATWAYEVGSQSMVCPIIVEDLDQPRQMLVEMLCEERGFFLEIADFIRGLGLTILKGLMEVENDKIWARFAVEANRDVTRMEIFMSLVRLLEQTGKPGASSSNRIENNMMMYPSFPQASLIPAAGRPRTLSVSLRKERA